MDLSGYKALINFCRSFSVQQLIKEPTCVCSSTQTIIDLVLVSEKSRIADSGVRNYKLRINLPIRHICSDEWLSV